MLNTDKLFDTELIHKEVDLQFFPFLPRCKWLPAFYFAESKIELYQIRNINIQQFEKSNLKIKQVYNHNEWKI